MSFLDCVQECFGSRELYAVLGVERSAGQAELKRAYYRLSLKVHPDRVEEEDVSEATKKFQVSLRERDLEGPRELEEEREKPSGGAVSQGTHDAMPPS